MAATPPPKLEFKIDPDPGFTLKFKDFEGTEELGRPFHYVVNLSSTKVKMDLTALLGSSVTVTMVNPDNSKRYFNGVVASIAYAGLRAGGRGYRMELRPWFWLLSQRKDCRIFQNKSIWDIITAVCRNAGFSDFADKRGAQPKAGSQTVEYCVQYDETSFDFITRLMEEYGIYYYFTHADGKHTLNFADDPSSHSSIGAAIPFRTRQTGSRAVADHVWQWSSELTVVPGKVSYTDYNFTTSGVDLSVRSSNDAGHKYDAFEWFEYPGRHPTTAIGQALSDVRLQHYVAQRRLMFGVTNSRLLYTGSKFTLSNFYEAADNIEYTVVRATYTLAARESRATTGAATADIFRVSFEAIKGTTPFRLARTTPRPRIPGPQTAKVVTEPTGSTSDEIVTDKYGRIKVKFPWARPAGPGSQSEAEVNDQKASCWIRVAQMWAGVTWGGMVIPRVGMEVVVEFLDGDPDRPLVTGCVYNDAQTVPYALPDNKTRSTFKTNSSTGGGGYNELRFEDKKGSEEVYFQAQKDYNKVVLNNETVNITQDTTTTVKQGNRSVTVSQGNNSFTVSTGTNTTKIKGDNSLTVDTGNNKATVTTGDDTLTVSAGNHKIDVSAGSSTYSAAQSVTITGTQSVTIKSDSTVTLQVGSNSITISTSGISISAGQFSVSATGTASLSASGAMTLSGATIALN